jgi:GTP-binding protein EngB required for normal cell division
MKASLNQLTEGLQQVVALLDQPSPFSFIEGRRAELNEEAERLVHKLHDAADEVLTIGLLGGTGVGKSTIMNALAGSNISSTSHRRPHTDKVLVYRHDLAQLPPALHSNEVPRVEHAHHIDVIAKIVLCDLPDFDSLLGEHRDLVIQFLDNLDLLVWVSSPEKYADAKFYELLELVPKAKKNFYFVLNKADLLFTGHPVEEGYRQIEAVMEQFRAHLRRTHIDDPILFALSAEQARYGSESAPWNQFAFFRQHVFQQRDIKEVTTIKAANLDIEVGRLIKAVQKELRRLESLKQALDELRKGLQGRLSDWREVGRDAIDDWLTQDLTDLFMERLEDGGALVGIGRGILTIRRHWRAQFERRSPTARTLDVIEPECVTTAYCRQWDLLRTKVDHLLLRQHIPEAQTRHLKEIFGNGCDPDALGERLKQVVENYVRYLQPVRRPLFRLFQIGSYTLFAALLLLALGGRETWYQTITAPTSSHFNVLFFTLLSGFFSTTGVAALAALAAINLLLAFRFHHRYKKFLRRRAQKIIESLKVELATIWDNSWEALVADLDRLSDDLEHQLGQAATLGNREKGP